MSPMMEQYFKIKEQYRDYLLFYRLGDFYEMFFDDAKVASRELELTLTGRDCGEDERAPMCGVPFHSADTYIQKLIAKGYKIAICEQTEDPAKAKGLVKREVIRIVTAGTVLEAEMLPEGRNNYLASVCLTGTGAGVCFADVSTGEVCATSFEARDAVPDVLCELGTYSPSELLLNREAAADERIIKFAKERLFASVESGRDVYFAPDEAARTASEQFGGKIGDKEKADLPLIRAIGALVAYVAETQKSDISYIKELSIYDSGRFMQLDLATRRNLELTEALRTREKKGTLLWILDRTVTAAGARMLRGWIEHPLLSVPRITRRQSAVAELCSNTSIREELREQLSGVLDLERLLTKAVYGSANARDLRAVGNTLRRLPAIISLLEGTGCDELASCRRGIDRLDELCELIDRAIVENPPFSVREGGMIATGYNEDVDRLRSIMNDGKGWIEREAELERERTGIKTLRIGYNRVFGYYIEVSNSFKDQVPETYIRKQTLSNAERYITDELKRHEAEVLGAADRLAAAEYELFSEVRAAVADASDRIQKTAAALASLDVYCSLSSVATSYGYVCPSLNTNRVIEIRDGRHPVVEQFVSGSAFVPNDTHLDVADRRVMIITGPNMAGKSTYMRQVAMIAVMTQIGSFIPASSADMCILDRVFTRIGASDDLASGQSTFMLEMNEVATILRSATRDSLIVYDEVGRGTSTFDGMSIAGAILEYTAKKIKAKTMFATHYHELTSLEGEVEGIFNTHIAARKHGSDVIFLRKIVSGATDDSYGIEVAKLAGVPGEVINRAKAILAGLELKKPSAEHIEEAPEHSELGIDSFINDGVIDDIKSADLNNMSPFDAMNLLFELQRRLR